MPMQIVVRQISLLGRKRDSAKDRRRVLKSFAAWKALQKELPSPLPGSKSLLVIRLDDIGDYLLFRNQLGMYKQSRRWADHTITLLGNASWRELFLLLDKDAVDDVIWVDKNQYLENADYRTEVWRQLRDRQIETVIAPSCTRPLLLDDLCMLAAAPANAIGCVNSNVHASWNEISDALYSSLFTAPRALMHEFAFNVAFSQWACGLHYVGRGPQIARKFPAPIADPYIICFVGASIRSKRWPVKRWIEFIELYRSLYSGEILLAGNGNDELNLAQGIQERTGAQSIVGKASLAELLGWVAGARAVVTNDTMAAHLSASYDRPTVIVANGINYMRFSEYANIGATQVATIYPEVVMRRRERQGDGLYAYSETVSADIISIQATTVMQVLSDLLAASEKQFETAPQG